MLEVDVLVSRGIIFFRLVGELNPITIHDFDQKLNYLLYQQGMIFFVFNLQELSISDQKILSHLWNKLIEIFLSCGKVVMCGLNEFCKRKLGTQEKLFYVDSEYEAFQYFSV